MRCPEETRKERRHEKGRSDNGRNGKCDAHILQSAHQNVDRRKRRADGRDATCSRIQRSLVSLLHGKVPDVCVGRQVWCQSTFSVPVHPAQKGARGPQQAPVAGRSKLPHTVDGVCRTGSSQGEGKGARKGSSQKPKRAKRTSEKSRPSAGANPPFQPAQIVRRASYQPSASSALFW